MTDKYIRADFHFQSHLRCQSYRKCQSHLWWLMEVNMSIFLIVIIILLLVIIVFQYYFSRTRSKNLDYITNKIISIIDDDSSDKIMVFTGDDQLRSLLEQINNLLEYNHEKLVHFNKTEISMRKMLANISHDLKTPLTVILGYLETIRVFKNMKEEEKEQILSKIYSKTQEILELINKFFDLAKLESGDTEIPITRINVNEICRKNILSFYDILTSTGNQVSIEIPDNNIFALANEEALDRILNNLISNSIKYGSDGKIIGLTLEKDEHYAFIKVWDRGSGISDIHKDKIFERMYTLDDSRNKLFQGSGLGLTITKRLVERISGEITVTSQPYEKTEFIVKLRLN